MAKTKVSEWSSTPGSNTDIDGINLAEGMLPSDVNNALREMMSQLKNQQAGLDGDNFTVDGSLILNGATSGATTIQATDAVTATITLPSATTTLVGKTTPSFTTTIGVGNATPSASGAGITFPATQSASTDVNTLDDYEEGTWTPALARVGTSTLTYTSQNGHYVKIGQQVTVTFRVAINAVTTQGSSVNYVTNLPFPTITAASSGIYFAGSVGQNTAFATITVNTTQQAADGIGNITFHEATNNENNVNADWVAGGIIVGTTTYFTT